MTTHDSVAEGKADNLPFVTVTKDGAFVPEARDVLAFVAKHQLTLATGHVTPVEQLMVVREAKRLGVQRIVVTHEGSIPGPMTMAQLKEAAALGAFIEVVSGNGAGAQAKAKADRIKELGPERVIVSSDLGLLGGRSTPTGSRPLPKPCARTGSPSASST